MAALLIILIIAGCVAYLLLKSTLVKSFTVLITTVSAAIIAFAFFELLSNVFIGRNIIVPWAQPLSFILLFILSFAILQTIAAQLARKRFELGLLTERIGRVICGIFLGLIVSGLLLTALAMAPIPTKYPYQRFDRSNPNAEKPDKVLFNADGFVTRCFGIVSSGGFSGKRSFALLHPAFLDQVFLNRHNFADDVSIITSPEAIKIQKKAVWPAPQDIKDLDGRPIPSKSAHSLTIIRVGFSNKILKKSPTFTLSQLRLVCKRKDDSKKPLAGKGINIYPIGYLRTASQLLTKRLNDKIELERADFKTSVCEIDFAFYLPNGFVPVLVEFKQNSIAGAPPPVTPEQAPPPLTFIPISDCTITDAKLQPL
ncbi:MAG: CvpA family protein, partial [Sedimentisphaerales bacterium]